MKFFIAIALLVAAASAAPVSPTTGDKDAETVQYDSQNIAVEPYSYKVQTSNGISFEEFGGVKNIGTDNEALEVRGKFGYPGPDGVFYEVTYVANELGFQPSAPHLPVAPQP